MKLLRLLERLYLAPFRAPLQGRILALPTNIRLGWKGLPGISILRKFVNYGRKRVLQYRHLRAYPMKLFTVARVFVPGTLQGSTLGQDPGLTHVDQNRLERVARDKHSSLLQKFVNYGHKIVLQYRHPRAYPMKLLRSLECLSLAHFRAPLQGRILALPTNIRLGWKGLPGKNTIAYYENS